MEPYYKNDLVTLYHGDCLELMNLFQKSSIDMILCDLPYGTTSCQWDSAIPFEELWKNYNRLVKPKRNVILFGSGLFAYKLALSNEKKFRYEMIWKKSKCGSPFTAKYMPMKKHENILVFGDSASYYDPQMEIGKPYRRKWTENKHNNLKYGISGTEHVNNGTRHPSTILDFPQKWRRQDQVHPTQKPVELMEWLIRSFCPENGVVMDNCAGSGTTGIACMNTNRKCVLIEKEEKYCEITKIRLESHTVQKELF